MSVTTSAESCRWKGKQNAFQTKLGHSTSLKMVTKKGKRMVNNLGQRKEMDLNTKHTKEALRKVYRRSR